MNPTTNPAIDTLHALRDNWAAGGDMGRPDGFVAVREGVDGVDGEAFAEAYAVKIELWTDDCLMDLKKQDEAAARRRGEALAKKWAKEHWPHTGYVDLGGAEGVYGATWAWDKATENELERTDPDEVVRLPAARANPDVTSTPAFRRWFGDSEVVDAAGEPLVVWHGTDKSFDVFKTRSRSVNSTTFGPVETARSGIFVSDNPEFSREFGSRLLSLYARIENPAEISAAGRGFGRDPAREFAETIDAFTERDLWLQARHVSRPWQLFDGQLGPRFIAYLQELGHDGATFIEDVPKGDDVGEDAREYVEGRTYVVFDPQQVKSATDNDGTFDLDDADLRSNPAALRKKDFLAVLAVPENRKAVEKFVDVVRAYQSDSAGYKSALANRYLALPESVQDAISEPKANLKKLYRGDDGKSRARATSWTSSLDYAKLFGQYVFPYAALASHGGTINTHKLVRLLDFAFEDHDVGDDEDEVVILEPVWKSADSDDGYLVKNVKGYWFPRE